MFKIQFHHSDTEQISQKNEYGKFGNWINLYLDYNDGLIYVSCGGEKTVVASTNFIYKITHNPKARICWYDTETSLKFKNFKVSKRSVTSSFMLSQASASDDLRAYIINYHGHFLKAVRYSKKIFFLDIAN